MTKITRKRPINKLSHSFWSYLILIILASLFIYSAIGAYHKSHLANQKVEIAKKNLNNLESQKTKLVNELQNANTDFGREKTIRERFNVIKEGEQVIILVDDKEKDEDKNTPTHKESSFIEFFRNIFNR